MGQGCSHGSFFSFFQLLPQCLNLTEKMASLSLVLSLFGFCLEHRKMKIEQVASSPGDVFSFSDNRRAWAQHGSSVPTRYTSSGEPAPGNLGSSSLSPPRSPFHKQRCLRHKRYFCLCER